MLVWLGIWPSGRLSLPVYYGVIDWHSHEMLFGYGAAVIAGFLLTAVRNWTGVNTPTGTPLALLALLWLAGRLAPLLAGVVPAPVIAILDLAFLPTVALAIGPALWRGKQKINRIFVPLLLLMGLANLLVHLQPLGWADTASRGIDMMLYLVLFLVTIIGSRVMPFFTEAVVAGYQPVRRPWVETASVITFVLIILLQPVYPEPMITGLLALSIAGIQAVRAAGWYHPGIWRTPILWVLYSGFFWIITGFLMLGLSGFGLVAANLAKHALTVGGIGILTLGMMARVSLGHTGRPLQPARPVEFAFVLLNLAAALRVFGPLLRPESYNLWIHLSGGVWMLCFLIFCAVYLPVLFRPRIDGKPG